MFLPRPPRLPPLGAPRNPPRPPPEMCLLLVIWVGIDGLSNITYVHRDHQILQSPFCLDYKSWRLCKRFA
jgi:hypothetical protein